MLLSGRESVLPLLSSSLPPRYLRRAVVDEYRAQNKIGTPTHRYSRPGNEDMRAPMNTVGRGSTFPSFFLPLFLSPIYTHTYAHIHTHMHTYTRTLYLPFFFFPLSSSPFPLSLVLSFPLDRASYLFLSRRDVRSPSMARSRPSLETAHPAVPFVAPLDDDRPLRNRQSTLTTAVALLAKDQVRSANTHKQRM